MKSSGPPTRADFHEAISTRSGNWYAACLKITRNEALAEDALQDALLNAWHKRKQFKGDARLDTWIHRIAVNSALQVLRRNRNGVFEPLESDIADATRTPESAQHAYDMHAELTAALSGLSELERVCFVLKHFEEWRLKEIAGELGTGVDTIKQALVRGVRKMRLTVRSLKSA